MDFEFWGRGRKKKMEWLQMYIIIEAWKLFAPFFHPRKSYFGFEQTPVICIRFCVFVKKGWHTVCLFARTSIKVNNSIGKLCTTVKHYNSSRFRIVIEIIVCKNYTMFLLSSFVETRFRKATTTHFAIFIIRRFLRSPKYSLRNIRAKSMKKERGGKTRWILVYALSK